MAATAPALAGESILPVGVTAGVATLALNRPRQSNALPDDLLTALRAAWMRAPGTRRCG